MFGFGRWRRQIEINRDQIACNNASLEVQRNLVKTNNLLMERLAKLEARVAALERHGVTVRWDEHERGFRTDDGIVFKAYDR